MRFSRAAASGILSQLSQTAGLTLPAGLGSTAAPISAQAAEKVTPEMAQEAAAQVAQHDPSIVERISEICAQHPTLVKTLGAVAMSVALSHLAKRR